MYKMVTVVTGLFALFIGWVIYMADTQQSMVFFDWVEEIPYGDKLGHFFLFGFLTLGVNIGWKMRGFTLGNLKIPYGSVGIVTIVVVEECSQYFIPSRTLDMTDIIADFIGIAVFSFIAYAIEEYISKRRGLDQHGPESATQRL